MSLHIYFRHTPVARSSGKSRPDWFSHERCFVNLLDTIVDYLADGDVRLNVIFDGSDAEVEADFAASHVARRVAERPALAKSIVQRRIQGGTQRTAWRACVALVKADTAEQISPGDLVYLLENDYLHMPGWVDEVAALKRHGVSWDYLTLYDHPDKYPNLCTHLDASRYRALPARLFATEHRHWRTTPSTCATYMLSRETFLHDYALLRLGLYDLRLFRLLTKLKRRTLISPLPAMATHCMAELLSPTVDWEGVSRAAPPPPDA